MVIETMSDTVICETRACEARAPLDYLLADILRAQDLSPSSSSFESLRDDVHTATDKDQTRVKQLTRQMKEVILKLLTRTLPMSARLLRSQSFTGEQTTCALSHLDIAANEVSLELLRAQCLLLSFLEADFDKARDLLLFANELPSKLKECARSEPALENLLQLFDRLRSLWGSCWPSQPNIGDLFSVIGLDKKITLHLTSAVDLDRGTELQGTPGTKTYAD
jgi:hypothetical protein